MCSREMFAMRICREDAYNRALYWILRERAGAGGWPPHTVNKVAGWLVVRLLAGVYDKTVREVAADLIERYKLYAEKVETKKTARKIWR